MMYSSSATNAAPNLRSTFSRGYAANIYRCATYTIHQGAHITSQQLVIDEMNASKEIFAMILFL